MPILVPEVSDHHPLYRQIREMMEEQILAGHYSHRRLPSLRSLARELGVSRTTVNLAYQELVDAGIIMAMERSGFTVNKDMTRLRTAASSNPKRDSGHNSPDWTLLAGERFVDPLPRIEKPVDWFNYPYCFLAGQMALESFPIQSWIRNLRRALEPPHLWYSLQDGQSADDPLLIEQLCAQVLPARGISAETNEVLVTMGTQQGLHLIAQSVISPDVTAAIEDPGYPDAWHIFLRAGAHLMPTPIDNFGIVPIHALANARVVYTTPSHQFPTNVTMSLRRRRELSKMARDNGVLILEDDYDSEFRYRGQPTPALKAMDSTGHVIYLGSFSKFLAPGLRLGFVVGDVSLIDELRDRRRYMIRHPPGHLQRAIALFIQSGEYHRTINRTRVILARKFERSIDAVQNHLGWEVQSSGGGVSLWISGPDGIDTRKLAIALRDRGVLIEPGDTFYLRDVAPTNKIRLGFASVPLERIEPGVRIIGEEAKHYLDQS